MDLSGAISHAQTALEKHGLIAYPAGKNRLAPKLVKMIPPHVTYVEAFCGSAALFFAKKQSEIEVLGDLREDMIKLYKQIVSLTEKDLDALDEMDWIGSSDVYDSVKSSSPKSRVGKVYKTLYLTRFSRMKDPRSGAFDAKGALSPGSGLPARATYAKRVRKYQPRLQNAELICGDYRELIEKYDGPDTFFFLDPPYVGYDVNVGEKNFDESEFSETLDSIEGKFLVTYGVRGKTDFPAYFTKEISDDQSRGLAGGKGVPTLLISNYDTERTDEMTKLNDAIQGAQNTTARIQAQKSAAAIAGDVITIAPLEVIGDMITDLERFSDDPKVLEAVNVLRKSGQVYWHKPGVGGHLYGLTPPTEITKAEVSLRQKESKVQAALEIRLFGEPTNNRPCDRYVWIADLFESSVVYEDNGGGNKLMRIGYAFDQDGNVLFTGEAEEVVRGYQPAVAKAAKIGVLKSVLSRKIRITKADDDEQRFAFGIVLEPETTDSQGDVYSGDEVRKAAHLFVDQFKNAGFMHTELVNDKVKIVESGIIRDDSGEATIGGQVVKSGTWVIGMKIEDDELWAMVKSGDLTGLSIGGSSFRVPLDE